MTEIPSSGDPEGLEPNQPLTPPSNDATDPDLGDLEEEELEELEAFPVEVREVLVSISRKIWSGPLPPPSTLAKYDEIVPGLADRIISQWEQQSKHRQGLEKAVANSNIENERRGLRMGFGVYCIGLIFCFVMVFIGQIAVGTTLFLSEMIALAVVFITGKRQSSKALRQKAERIDPAEPEAQPDEARLEPGDH